MNERKIITREGLSCAKIIYTEYIPQQDITVIFEDILNKKANEIISTEIKGFYYGEPNENDTEHYMDKIKHSRKAEFTWG